MCKYRFVSILLLLALNIHSYSQKMNLGLSIGTGLNFTATKSKEDIQDNIYDNGAYINSGFRPLEAAGLNLGLHTETLFGENFTLNANIEYFRTHQGCKKITFYDQVGNMGVESVNRRIINNNIQLNIVPAYSINTYTLGIGIYTNALIRSTTITENIPNIYNNATGELTSPKKRQKNLYFAPFSLGLTAMAAVDLGISTLYVRYNHGITDKVRGKENKVKEYDRSFILGLFIYFTK